MTENNTHKLALSLAREAMLVDGAAGCSLGAWREAVIEICKKVGMVEPSDVLAWVSEGKASDGDVVDWSRQFSVR
jgi:hypothetical protein